MTAARIVVALAAAALSSACSAGAVPAREGGTRMAPSVPAGGLLIRGAGATFPSVLYEEWFRRYQADHPTSVIAYDAVGSGEGTRRFIGRAIPDEVTDGQQYTAGLGYVPLPPGIVQRSLAALEQVRFSH